MVIGATVDAAADSTLAIGPLSRAAAEVDAATKARIRDRVIDALGPYTRPGGVALATAVWLVGARPGTIDECARGSHS
jgi:hypothetical protein